MMKKVIDQGIVIRKFSVIRGSTLMDGRYRLGRYGRVVRISTRDGRCIGYLPVWKVTDMILRKEGWI